MDVFGLCSRSVGGNKISQTAEVETESENVQLAAIEVRERPTLPLSSIYGA
jgi:hypothetical protein